MQPFCSSDLAEGQIQGRSELLWFKDNQESQGEKDKQTKKTHPQQTLVKYIQNSGRTTAEAVHWSPAALVSGMHQ